MFAQVCGRCSVVEVTIRVSPLQFVRSARRGAPDSQYRTCVKIGDNIRCHEFITHKTEIPVTYRGYEKEGDENDGGT